MELTKGQLSLLIPKNPYIDHWFHALEQLLPDYEINKAIARIHFIMEHAAKL